MKTKLFFILLSVNMGPLIGMAPEHPKKHLKSQLSRSEVSDQTQITKKGKSNEDTPSLSPLQLVPYTPTDPTENHDATPYGLKLLLGDTKIGRVRFETFLEDSGEEKPTNHLLGEIAYLSVKKEFRNSGYGRKLLDAACTLLQEKGCQEIRLTASPENSKDMVKLIQFYEKAGFKLEEDFDLSQFDKQDEDPGIHMYKIITQ